MSHLEGVLLSPGPRHGVMGEGRINGEVEGKRRKERMAGGSGGKVESKKGKILYVRSCQFDYFILLL